MEEQHRPASLEIKSIQEGGTAPDTTRRSSFPKATYDICKGLVLSGKPALQTLQAACQTPPSE